MSLQSEHIARHNGELASLPKTTLTIATSATNTTVLNVVDSSVFPDAPNSVVLAGGEVFNYTGMTPTTLTGVAQTLGVNPIGTIVYEAHASFIYNRMKIEEISIPSLDVLSVMTDWGNKPARIEIPNKLSVLGVSTDWGVIPSKNYFRGKIETLTIELGQFAETRFNYKINTRG